MTSIFTAKQKLDSSVSDEEVLLHQLAREAVDEALWASAHIALEDVEMLEDVKSKLVADFGETKTADAALDQSSGCCCS